MSFKDLRSFLRKLDEEGQLVKYDQPIRKLSPEWYDMVRALPRLGQYGPGPDHRSTGGLQGSAHCGRPSGLRRQLRSDAGVCPRTPF